MKKLVLLKSRSSARSLGCAAVVLLASQLLQIAPAAALTPACQAELDKYAGARLTVIEKINAFQKKRPTAKQACGTFGELVKAEAEMLKWMEDNLAWCQLPEPFVEDFKKSTAQGTKARSDICTTARKQQQQPAAPRGPAPGSGVPLPKGAL